MELKQATKRFDTIETIKRLLEYKAVMFDVIDYLDKHQINAIPETQYYALVLKLKQQLNKEKATEMSVVFDIQNLIMARVINDRRSIDGDICLLFNTTVFEVFRLCKVSLFRPLTKVALNTSMSPLWSIAKQLKEARLSTVPGSEDYKEWVDDLIFRVSVLLGNIKANIAKLENVGQQFEKNIQQDSSQQPLIEARRESFQLASRLFKREIKPLKTFLDKQTRYHDGDGIFILLQYFREFFDVVGDRQNEEIILSYELQYLDLFLPIKKVASTVSIYLQKTQQSILEQSAIEKAYGVILDAYEKTLGSDMRNKFIDLKDLSPLSLGKHTPAVNRLLSFRADKNQSFLNISFRELENKVGALNEQGDGDTIELTESLNSDAAERLEYSLKLQRWIEETKWPENTDFVQYAHDKLLIEMPEYTLPDLFEIQSNILNKYKNSINILNEYKQIENEEYQFQYRVRHILMNNLGLS